MDSEYLNRTIEHLLKQKAEHDVKFAGVALHAGCLARFDQAIDKLRKERDKALEAASDK